MYNILTDEEVADLFTLFRNTQNTFIQKVVKALPDLMYVMNLDNYAVIYSSRLIALDIGYTAKDVEEMTHPLFDIMHPDDRSRFLAHLENVKNSNPGEVLAIEYRLIRHNGTIAWFTDRNTVFTRNLDREAVTKIGITHEISDRKAEEQSRLKSQKIIEQSEALSGTGSWEYDCRTKDFRWSAGMYRLFNLPYGTPVKPDIYTRYCIDEDLNVAERIVRNIESEQSPSEETLHITVDGKIRSLRIKAAPLYDQQTDCTVIVGVDLDITSILEKERQLKLQTRDLQVQNRQIQLLHHEQKTLANTMATEYHETFKNIYTAFEFIVTQEAGRFSNNGKAVIRKVQSSIQRLNLITDDIENYLTIEKALGETTLVSLDEVVHDVLEHYANRIVDDNIKVKRGELGSVKGDYNLLFILFRNLIENAMKFSRESSEPTISIYGMIEDDLSLIGTRTTSTDRVLSVNIEDSGPGIPADELHKIFDLFYKNHRGTKMRGSGVGLAVAKKIMNMHDGLISISPNDDKGAKFTCYFPL